MKLHEPQSVATSAKASAAADTRLRRSVGATGRANRSSWTRAGPRARHSRTAPDGELPHGVEVVRVGNVGGRPDIMCVPVAQLGYKSRALHRNRASLRRAAVRSRRADVSPAKDRVDGQGGHVGRARGASRRPRADRVAHAWSRDRRTGCHGRCQPHGCALRANCAAHEVLSAGGRMAFRSAQRR